MSLASLVSRRVSRLKGQDYAVDDRLSDGYLLGVLAERVAMRVRGMLRFPRRSARPFVGAGARFRASSRLRFGRGVTFGPGCYIDAMSVDGVVLGDHSSVGRNTRIEATGSLRHLGVGLRAGANVGLGTDSFYGCAGGITIGADTIVGNFVSFHAENHVLDDLDVPIRLQGVTHAGISIGADCWLGARTTVLDGAQVGDGCVFAAGSVVIAGRYPPRGIYGGVPARLLRQRTAADRPADLAADPVLTPSVDYAE